MSTAEILSLISLISYIASGALLLLTVFFWFAFKIPTVIGDLSGRTAKKSIARMRASNERAGGQGYKPSATNANRGKLTDLMLQPEKVAKPQKKAEEKKQVQPEEQMPETGLLASNKAEAEVTPQTELLSDEEATGLLVDEDATMLLNAEPEKVPARSGGKKLTILDEVILIHTDEVIA